MLQHREFLLRKQKSYLRTNLTSQTVRQNWGSTFNFQGILTAGRFVLLVCHLCICLQWEGSTTKATTVSEVCSYIPTAASGRWEFHFDFIVRPRSRLSPCMRGKSNRFVML